MKDILHIRHGKIGEAMRREKEEYRTVNRELLRELIRDLGHRGKERAAVEIDCSASLIEKMMTQDGRQAPDRRFRKRFCDFLGTEESKLFPTLENEEIEHKEGERL